MRVHEGDKSNGRFDRQLFRGAIVQSWQIKPGFLQTGFLVGQIVGNSYVARAFRLTASQARNEAVSFLMFWPATPIKANLQSSVASLQSLKED